MYDVIIVGAGPAGASAAIFAKKAGLKTLLLEKSFFPRDKICGDALSGKSVRLMRDLGILSDVENLNGAKINTITFGSPSNRQFDVSLINRKDKNKSKKGFVIPKKIFDNYLFEKANEISETRQGSKVVDLVKEQNKVKGVIVKNDKGISETLLAPIILGCDGPYSVIARKLGLYNMDMKNTSVAIRCYYSGVEDLRDQIELHF